MKNYFRIIEYKVFNEPTEYRVVKEFRYKMSFLDSFLSYTLFVEKSGRTTSLHELAYMSTDKGKIQMFVEWLIENKK